MGLRRHTIRREGIGHRVGRSIGMGTVLLGLRRHTIRREGIGWGAVLGEARF